MIAWNIEESSIKPSSLPTYGTNRGHGKGRHIFFFIKISMAKFALCHWMTLLILWQVVFFVRNTLLRPFWAEVSNGSRDTWHQCSGLYFLISGTGSTPAHSAQNRMEDGVFHHEGFRPPICCLKTGSWWGCRPASSGPRATISSAEYFSLTSDILCHELSVPSPLDPCLCRRVGDILHLKSSVQCTRKVVITPPSPRRSFPKHFHPHRPWRIVHWPVHQILIRSSVK